MQCTLNIIFYTTCACCILHTFWPPRLVWHTTTAAEPTTGLPHYHPHPVTNHQPTVTTSSSRSGDMTTTDDGLEISVSLQYEYESPSSLTWHSLYIYTMAPHNTQSKLSTPPSSCRLGVSLLIYLPIHIVGLYLAAAKKNRQNPIHPIDWDYNMALDIIVFLRQSHHHHHHHHEMTAELNIIPIVVTNNNKIFAWGARLY